MSTSIRAMPNVAAARSPAMRTIDEIKRRMEGARFIVCRLRIAPTCKRGVNQLARVRAASTHKFLILANTFGLCNNPAWLTFAIAVCCCL
jgi:hypothetical protein